MSVQREVVAQPSNQAVAQNVAQEAEARHAHLDHAVYTEAKEQVDLANSRQPLNLKQSPNYNICTRPCKSRLLNISLNNKCNETGSML